MITKRERLEAMAREWRQYADSHSGEIASTLAHCSRKLLEALHGDPIPHTTLPANHPAPTDTQTGVCPSCGYGPVIALPAPAETALAHPLDDMRGPFVAQDGCECGWCRAERAKGEAAPRCLHIHVAPQDDGSKACTWCGTRVEQVPQGAPRPFECTPQQPCGACAVCYR